MSVLHTQPWRYKISTSQYIPSIYLMTAKKYKNESKKQYGMAIKFTYESGYQDFFNYFRSIGESFTLTRTGSSARIELEDGTKYSFMNQLSTKFFAAQNKIK